MLSRNHFCHGKSRSVRARLKRDGTRAETRFGLSAKRTSPLKSARESVQSTTGTAEVCASAVVMLDTPCSEVQCKITGYPLHSHVSPSLPLPCVSVCHQVSTELYIFWVCVCSLSHPRCKEHPPYYIFIFHDITRLSEKKLLKIKYVLPFSMQIFQNISHSKNTERDIIIAVRRFASKVSLFSHTWIF